MPSMMSISTTSIPRGWRTSGTNPEARPYDHVYASTHSERGRRSPGHRGNEGRADPGLTCSDCARRIQASVASLNGVRRVEVDVATGTLSFEVQVPEFDMAPVASRRGDGT